MSAEILQKTNIDNEPQRERWLDCIRAMAMIFVVFGHHVPTGSNWYIYYVITSPIKIPLFFAISGYLFKPEKYSFPEFIKKIARQLIIPWLILGLLSAILGMIVAGSSFTDNVLKLISGTSYWYMPCCILAEIMFYFICKIKKTAIQFLVIVALFAAGLLTKDVTFMGYAMLNRAFTAQLYLFLGLFIKRHPEIFDMSKIWMAILAVVYAALAILSILFFPGRDMDVHMMDYYFIPLNMAAVLSGVLLVFALSAKLKLHSKVIEAIGKNTLVIYMLNAYPLSVFTKVCGIFGITFNDGFISAILFTVISIFGSLLIALVLNKFLPEVVGKKRKKVSNA